MKVKLICDSLCDFPSELIKLHNIDVIPLTIIVGDKEYKDEVDLTKEKILHYIDKNLDREKLASKLDYELFAEIIEMYNSCLN